MSNEHSWKQKAWQWKWKRKFNVGSELSQHNCSSNTVAFYFYRQIQEWRLQRLRYRVLHHYLWVPSLKNRFLTQCLKYYIRNFQIGIGLVVILHIWSRVTLTCYTSCARDYDARERGIYQFAIIMRSLFQLHPLVHMKATAPSSVGNVLMTSTEPALPLFSAGQLANPNWGVGANHLSKDRIVRHMQWHNTSANGIHLNSKGRSTAHADAKYVMSGRWSSQGMKTAACQSTPIAVCRLAKGKRA